MSWLLEETLGLVSFHQYFVIPDEPTEGWSQNLLSIAAKHGRFQVPTPMKPALAGMTR
jgi:hypothetical protein